MRILRGGEYRLRESQAALRIPVKILILSSIVVVAKGNFLAGRNGGSPLHRLQNLT
jgi:hypothetical protein